MTRGPRWLFAVCLGATLGVPACGTDGDGTSADGISDTTTEQSAIYKGTALTASDLAASGLVAIYHPKLPNYPRFYPRPCSGVILRSYDGLSTVLTARHCVTEDGVSTGTLVDGSALSLSPTLRPGPALPDPPADAVQAWFVVDKLGTPNDLALVYVFADWSSTADRRIGLYVGAPEQLVGAGLTSYGYGIDDADGSCGADNSTKGAGIARSGGLFKVGSGVTSASGQPDHYWYRATSTNGQAIYCGDSGGPQELIQAAPGRMIVGIMSDGARMDGDNLSVAFDFGLQNNLGGLYVTPRSLSTGNVVLGLSSSGLFKMVARGSSEMALFRYDSAAKLLWTDTGCVSAANGSPPPVARVAACNAADPTQQWTLRLNGQLYNPASGKCLNSGQSVTLAACLTFLPQASTPASTEWLFHVQP